MSRILLAIRCFLAVLFSNRLPTEAARLLPALPPATPPPAPEPEPAPVAPPPPIVVSVSAPQPVVAPESRSGAVASDDKAHAADLRRRGAIQLLGILQREGRLVDFLMEDLASYNDAQIGAAVRDIHRGCRRGLFEHVQVAAVRPEPDEAAVRVEDGYDPSQVRLIGNVTGKPPFHGTLKHHGWTARTITLPDPPASHDPLIINPAEVELGG